MPAHPSKGIPALRSADNRDAPPSSSEDRDQSCMPIANVATLAGSHTSGGWRESDISRLVMSTMRKDSPAHLLLLPGSLYLGFNSPRFDLLM